MIYVTGDTHGMPVRLSPESMPYSLQWGKKDTLIVCGDFGYLMNGGPREELFLRELSLRPYSVCFVDGNRENYDMLAAYPVVEWRGGQARRVRRNVYHLLRGQLYEMEGQRIFAMGGGFSVDKARRFPGVNWWPQEMPSPEEYAAAWACLEKAGMEADYIITHAAPLSVLEGLYPACPEERPLNEFLDRVKANVRYKRWYLGHMHLDTAMEDGMYAMFMTVRELETGNLVW